MKRTLFTIIALGVLIAGAIYCWQRSRVPVDGKNVPRTTIEFLKDSVDFGTFPYAETKRAVFRFRNTGPRPLIVKNATSSCGCAEIKWNKRPVAPGQTDSLTILFTPNSLGQFNKSVEIICNTHPDKHLISLKGFVEE